MDAQPNLFDAGEPIATEDHWAEEHHESRSAREQLEIVWSTVMPLYPLESEWIHAPGCLCMDCREERCRLMDLRIEQRRRCEADRQAIAERVALYAAIKEQDMDAPLPFDQHDEYEAAWSETNQPQGDE